jgi:hypothetical protein
MSRRLIDYLLFHVPLENVLLIYGDVTIGGEVQQNSDLFSTFRAFEQGGIFILTHMPRHGAPVFPVSSKGLPHSVAPNDTEGDVNGDVSVSVKNS